MPRRTMKELAAENAVLFGKLEDMRDDLDEFLDDGEEAESGDEEADDGSPDDNDEDSV